MQDAKTHRTIEAIWRMESARLISGLTRLVRDVGLAEDIAQDALVAAMETWPRAGIPDNPGAWLTTVAKRRAMDHFRRHKRWEEKITALGHEMQATESSGVDLDAIDDPVGDDLLRLIFMCCHPVLSTQARVALTLRLFGGLTTEEIARAFLTPVPRWHSGSCGPSGSLRKSRHRLISTEPR